jgi:hypothetical protein
VRLEDFFAGGNPVFCPGDVVFGFDLVVVFIVFVADVERRVGKNEVGKGFAYFAEDLYTVAADYLIQELLHIAIL